MSQQININVLKPHPRNNEFFDDLNGEEFERLKNSIRDEKMYNDILVSPDMTIISGHQRVRAAKELGMKLVPIKIDEDLQDDNSKLRALISNNFGRRKNDPTKDRKALATYVKVIEMEKLERIIFRILRMRKLRNLPLTKLQKN